MESLDADFCGVGWCMRRFKIAWEGVSEMPKQHADELLHPLLQWDLLLVERLVRTRAVRE